MKPLKLNFADICSELFRVCHFDKNYLYIYMSYLLQIESMLYRKLESGVSELKCFFPISFKHFNIIRIIRY